MGLLGIIVSQSSAKWILRAQITRGMSTLNAEVKKSKISSADKQVLMKLRRKTGYPIMKCKQALIKCNYDLNQALESIKADAIKEGWQRMETQGKRATSQGLVCAYQDDNHSMLVEVNCETDFVAKTSAFQSLVGTVARTVLHQCGDRSSEKYDLCTEELLSLKVPDKNEKIQDVLASTIGKLKENIQISRGLVTSVEPGHQEYIGVYTHPDLGTPRKGGRLPLMGRYAALVSLRSTALEPNTSLWFRTKGRDIAQHVVGMNPKVIGTPLTVVPEDTSPQLQEAAEAPPIDLSNPETKDPDFEDSEEEYVKEFDQLIDDSDELLKQAFLLDANITVQNWLQINQLEVLDFVRYEVGELQANESEID